MPANERMKRVQLGETMTPTWRERPEANYVGGESARQTGTQPPARQNNMRQTTGVDLKAMAQQQRAAQQQAPGGYAKDPNAAMADALFEQLMNRGPFRYDLQGDMLYRQYADQYSELGKQAMRNAMGTASSLTGGYRRRPGDNR